MRKNIVQIRYNCSYKTYENGRVYDNWRVGGSWQYIFKSEIEYINDKPYWKGKEIYEIIK